MKETYKCSVCGITYKKGWTDEEAKEELCDTFGDIAIEDCDIVCDDCYIKIIGKESK
jgi:DNA-directed RNA polymerase subunit RPC12/RpoP